MNEDFYTIAVTCQRFVDGIIDNLVDQMMKSKLTGRSDVHCRPFSHGVSAFEDSNRSRAVLLLICCHAHLLEKVRQTSVCRYSYRNNQRQTEVCRTSLSVCCRFEVILAGFRLSVRRLKALFAEYPGVRFALAQ